MRIESTGSNKKANWWTMLGLLLVPLILVSAISLLAYPKISKVRAAIVNLDQLVVIEGKPVPLGRQLAAKIVDQKDNITWVLADQVNAENGLKSGEYAAVVEIPKDFSAAATSFSKNNAKLVQQATIRIKVSKNSPVTDVMLAKRIANTAVDNFNDAITSKYLNNIYLGFNTVDGQFVTIAEGAHRLAESSILIKNGIAKSATGSEELSNGAQQLAKGMPDLAKGLNTVRTQGSELMDGVVAYTNGSTQLFAGIDRLTSGLRKLKARVQNNQADFSKLNELTVGASGIAQGAKKLDQGLNRVSHELQGLANGSTPMPPEVINNFMAKCPTPDRNTCLMLLKSFEAGFQTGTAAAVKMVNVPDPRSGKSLLQGSKYLAAGSQQLDTGVGYLARELPAQTAAQRQQLVAGISQIVKGAEELNEGAKPLSANASKLKEGSAHFKRGLETLNSSFATLPPATKAVATGMRELSAGLSQLVKGSDQLSSGAVEYANRLSTGKTQLPHYTVQDREKLSEVVAKPVISQESHSKALYDALWTVLLTIGLWIGAIVIYVVLRTVPSRIISSSRPTWQLVGAALVPGMLLVSVQVGLLGIFTGVLLKYSVVTTLKLIILLEMIGITFVVVNYAVAALFGGWGRIVMVILAAFGLVVGLASSVPGFVTGLIGFTPIGSGISAIRALLAGSPILEQVSGLMIWLVIGIFIALLAVERQRKLKLSNFRLNQV